MLPSLTSVRRLVCSSATGSRQMFGERTLASPEAVSITPNAPTNCQRDHGSTPPSAAAVTITPTRFTNDSRNTSARPRNARLPRTSTTFLRSQENGPPSQPVSLTGRMGT